MRVASATRFTALTLAFVLSAKHSTVAAASLGSAFDELSQPCQTTLKGMLTSVSEIGSCTQLADLVTTLVSRGSDSQESIVGAVAEWESSFCQSSGCEPQVLKKARNTIATVCKKELKAEKLIPVIAISVLGRGPQVREFICVADKGKKGKTKGDYCFRQVMEDLEAATYDETGDVFTVNYLSAILADPLGYIKSLKTMSWCTVCLNYLSIDAKPFMEDISPGSSQMLYGALKDKCKANFNAKRPPTQGKEVVTREGSKGLPPSIPEGGSSGSMRGYRMMSGLSAVVYVSLLVMFTAGVVLPR